MGGGKFLNLPEQIIYAMIICRFHCLPKMDSKDKYKHKFRKIKQFRRFFKRGRVREFQKFKIQNHYCSVKL